ncbi:hypothetical protein SAMN06264346_1193 [Chryseobacterium profundimaris]|uniref:Transposase n=1 Tax=Chryseobacterium profundimaris TaxID=1387275 RepID=A0ABY1PKG9_9FLAO|nr:hypothetical protein SAMN06264346_1193 [Chryseobacterium profundimaris]
MKNISKMKLIFPGDKQSQGYTKNYKKLLDYKAKQSRFTYFRKTLIQSA